MDNNTDDKDEPHIDCGWTSKVIDGIEVHYPKKDIFMDNKDEQVVDPFVEWIDAVIDFGKNDLMGHSETSEVEIKVMRLVKAKYLQTESLSPCKQWCGVGEELKKILKDFIDGVVNEFPEINLHYLYIAMDRFVENLTTSIKSKG